MKAKTKVACLFKLFFKISDLMFFLKRGHVLSYNCVKEKGEQMEGQELEE